MISVGKTLQGLGQNLVNKNSEYKFLFFDLENIKNEIYNIMKEKNMEKLKVCLKNLKEHVLIDHNKGKLKFK